MARPMPQGIGVPGLQAALEVASLEGHLAAAVRWCEEMGARDIEEISEEDVFPELAEALELKPLEKRRLKKALQSAAGTAATSVATGSSPMSSPQSQATSGSGRRPAEPGAAATLAAAVPPAGPPPPAPLQAQQGADANALSMGGGLQELKVKNTFLDFERPQVLSDLCRAQSVPMPQHLERKASHTEPEREREAPLREGLPAAAEADEEDEEDDEEDGEAEDTVSEVVEGAGARRDGGEAAASAVSGAPGPPTPTATGAHGSLYKTMTYDGFESSLEYEQAHNDIYRGGAVARPPDYTNNPAYITPPPAAEPISAEAQGMLLMQPVMPNVMMQPGMYPMHGYMPYPANWMQPNPLGDRPVPDGPQRANVLQRAYSVNSNIYRVHWTVDSRKLKSTDREAVSPSFELTCTGSPVQFKMVMRPKVMSDTKGGASFKKARGKGSVELRCVTEVADSIRPTVTFRLRVSNPSGNARRQESPRGPVRHDFSERAVCGLPPEQEEWDFTKAVDDRTHTFVICLEVLHET